MATWTLVAWLGALAVGSAHAQQKVYLTTVADSRLPVYTDQPVDASSRVLMSFQPVRKAAWLPPPDSALRRSVPEAGPRLARRQEVEPIVERVSQALGLDSALLLAVIEVESAFNPRALSPKGATGLMQVMPATAARYGRFDLWSPEQNIQVGARYLRDLLRMFDGNVELAVAGYNAGEGAVIRHGWRIPRYAETQAYVPKVMQRYRHYRQGRGATHARQP